jgi:hypothetical protein
MTHDAALTDTSRKSDFGLEGSNDYSTPVNTCILSTVPNRPPNYQARHSTLPSSHAHAPPTLFLTPLLSTLAAKVGKGADSVPRRYQEQDRLQLQIIHSTRVDDPRTLRFTASVLIALSSSDHILAPFSESFFPVTPNFSCFYEEWETAP